MAEKKDFGTKLKNLFTGKRPFPKRLLLALAPSLAISFTLLFFGPLDLSYISRDYVTYSALDILPTSAMITGAALLVLLLAAALPGGKTHAFIISLYSGFSLAMYIQGAFLNPDLGSLDGQTINWPGFSTAMAVNLVIWFLILLIPHLIHYFSNRTWRHFVTIASVALILMQAVSLTGKLIDQAKLDRSRHNSLYLSTENMLKVGSKNNIAVFLLDTTSESDLTKMAEKYPDSLSLFHDFTRYTNANTHYMYTVPSLVNLLTGETWDCENVSIRDYMNQAWQSEKAKTFYQTLTKEDYERNFYMLLAEAANDPGVLEGIFSNLKSSGKDFTINRSALLKLYKLSCYRYFPLTMKPFFVIYTTDINNLVSAQDAMTGEWDFITRMNEESLSQSSSGNIFSFYYLAGTHKPYRINDRGQLIHSDLEPGFNTNYADMEDQLAGFFYLIENYIRQLKEMKLYDNTGIIILADHGDNSNKAADHQPIYLVKMPGEKHDEITFRSDPITIQDRFIPDIMSMLKEETNQENITEPVERWSQAYAYDDTYPPLQGARFNVMREFRYSGDGDDLTEKWLNDDYITIPMKDSFY